MSFCCAKPLKLVYCFYSRYFVLNDPIRFKNALWSQDRVQGMDLPLYFKQLQSWTSMTTIFRFTKLEAWDYSLQKGK